MASSIDVTMVPEKEEEPSISSGSVAKKEEEEPSSSSGSVAKKEKRVEITKWNAVFLWAWDTLAADCAICKNNIMDLCNVCKCNQGSVTSEECTIAWGKCNHAFHLHCINYWIGKGHGCPLDNENWELRTSGE